MFSTTQTMTRRPLQLAFILQVCCLFGREGYSQDCVNGLMSAERVHQLGRVAGALRSGLAEQQRIIPDITFTCSGTVTKWIVAAEWNGGAGNTNPPEVQIWRKTAESGVYTIIHRNILRFCSESEMAIYEYTESIDVQSGDILGLFEPVNSTLGLYYTTTYGPANYYEDTGDELNPPSGNFSTASKRILYDMPLITVTVAPTDGSSYSHCISSFATMEMIEVGLQQVGSAYGRPIKNEYYQQRLIPGINFTCHGFVTKWILAARWSRTPRYHPELQTWKSTDNITYTKQESTVFHILEGSRQITYYEYSPNPPHEFNAGVDEPLNYIDRGSPPTGADFVVTDHDWNPAKAAPLVAVEVSIPQLELTRSSTTVLSNISRLYTLTSSSKHVLPVSRHQGPLPFNCVQKVHMSPTLQTASSWISSVAPSSYDQGTGTDELSAARYAGILSIGVVFGAVLGGSAVALTWIMVRKRRNNCSNSSNIDCDLEMNQSHTADSSGACVENTAYGAFRDDSTAPVLADTNYYMCDPDLPLCHQNVREDHEKHHVYDYVTQERSVGVRRCKPQGHVTIQNDCTDSQEYI